MSKLAEVCGSHKIEEDKCMKFKVALVLGVFTMAAVLLSGGHRGVFGPRGVLAAGPPSACLEIVSCTLTPSPPFKFIVKILDDGCKVSGVALGDDCATDVAKVVTSNQGCKFIEAGTGDPNFLHYSILCTSNQED
jgi:hypothetical protein